MGTLNLNKFFNPRSIAVIGVTAEPNLTASTVLRNLTQSGFKGEVYPINPQIESAQGVPCYPELTSLPECPDLAVVCTPLGDSPAAINECGKIGIPGVLVINPEFGEDGPRDRLIEAEISGVLSKYPTMRLIGPNTLGIIRPDIGLNASFTHSRPKPGSLALLSESGALVNAILDRAADQGIGLSHIISLGNTLDINFGDLIDYLGTDYHTRAIILYVESIDQSRSFMSAARAFAKIKPIVAYKARQYTHFSPKLSMSHVAAMISEDAVYEVAFQRAGIVRAMELDDVFEVAQLMACHRFPQGARLAIISNAGAAALVATDALLAHKGIPAEFSQQTLAQLHEALPDCEIHGNSVDLTDHSEPQWFADATQIVLADRQVDATLVILTPQVNTQPTQTAELLGALAKKAHKPIMAAWLGGPKVREGIRVLNQAGLPTHSSPEHAVRAFMHLVTYSRNLKILYETPRDIPLNFPLDRRKSGEQMDSLVMRASGFLTDFQTKQLLQTYGIPVCRTLEAYSAREAAKQARRIRTPVALKVLSTPPVTHKTEAGGVALNLRNGREIRRAFDYILESVRSHHPNIQVNGVTVQQMVNDHNSFKMILGAKKDPTFGAVVMIGMGGLSTGIYQDRALGLPPINERLAWHMLESLRSWPLLQGYRGQPGIDVDRLIEILMRFSYLIADYPELLEININPLIASTTEVIALDTITLLDGLTTQQAAKPYHHLAIRPYPEEYTRHAMLGGQTRVTLRPIRPEDEPMWSELLINASAESLKFRFRSMLKNVTHEMATRHCYIDYEREITIVGVITVEGRPKIIGVGSLSTVGDETIAEFAVMVADAWQGKGLGGLLLDYCIEIATNRGIHEIVAETDPQNRKMIAVFQKRGFKSQVCIEDDVVYLRKPL
jgi:acetyltransferase